MTFSKFVGFKLPAPLHDALIYLAARDGCSVSSKLRKLIAEEHVRRRR